MNTKHLLSILAAGLCGTMSSFAAVEFYVSPNGNDGDNGSKEHPFQTVEQAVLSVEENTETTIYLEKDATFLIGKLDLMENKIVTIIGDNTTIKGAEQPGYEGGEANRILRAATGCQVKISGVTFQNGRQVGYFPGGAIFFTGKTLEIDNCKFIDNEGGSCGGAIACRGGDVVVKNSYFENNYILGGGARGAAITHCGYADYTPSSLTVENCAFIDNDLTQGGQGPAISIYDPSTEGGSYSSINSLTVINSTFINNTSTDAYQAAIDISGNSDCTTTLVNNTFYKNDGALRLDFQLAPVYMFNNAVYANKTAVLGGWTIADSDRTSIVAYNNVLVGEEAGINEYIDDASLNGDKEACNNIVGKSSVYAFSTFGLDTELEFAENSAAAYLPINSESSILVNAGLDNSSEYTESNVIPTTDARGASANGKKDIGAYEFNGQFGSVNTIEANSSFVFAQTASEIIVTNKSNEISTVNVYSIDGKLVKTAKGSTVTISYNELPKGLVLVNAASNNTVETHKFIIR